MNAKKRDYQSLAQALEGSRAEPTGVQKTDPTMGAEPRLKDESNVAEALSRLQREPTGAKKHEPRVQASAVRSEDTEAE